MSEIEDVTVRLLSPEEAGALCSLIRRCYGDSYIDPSFYDEDAVHARLASRQLVSIGALTESGRLVGHMAIAIRGPDALSADAGMTLVDPAFRSQGIARRVAGRLAEEGIDLGLVGVHDYPVTVHAASQRIGAGFGVDTGLMLANVPGDVVFQHMDTAIAGVRTSSLIRWIPFARSPARRVFLPKRYRAQIEALYAACDLDRTYPPPDRGARDPESKLATSYDARRQTLRVSVARPGGDLTSRVASALRGPTPGPVLVAHLDLPLGHPETPAAAQEIRDLDFFFAGVLPEYRDGDTLRMQWLSDSVDPASALAINVESTRAIEAFVLGDRT